MATTTLTRNYRCKDVEVLTVSSAIVSTAQENLATITAKRANWIDPFFPPSGSSMQGKPLQRSVLVP